MSVGKVGSRGSTVSAHKGTQVLSARSVSSWDRCAGGVLTVCSTVSFCTGFLAFPGLG